MLLSTVVGVAVPVISHDIPEKVALSASRLLLSLASTVRPSFLARVPAMVGLLNRVASGQLKGLPLKVHSMTCEALAAMLVLPWPSLSEPEQVASSLVCVSVGLSLLAHNGLYMVCVSMFVLRNGTSVSRNCAEWFKEVQLFSNRLLGRQVGDRTQGCSSKVLQ